MRLLVLASVILATSATNAFGVDFICSTADGAVSISRTPDAEAVLVRQSEWVESGGNYTEEFSVIKFPLVDNMPSVDGMMPDLEREPTAAAIAKMIHGDAYLLSERIIAVATQIPLPEIEKCGPNDDPYATATATGLQSDVREITLAITGFPFPTGQWPLSGNRDGSLTNSYFCTAVYTVERKACIWSK